MDHWIALHEDGRLLTVERNGLFRRVRARRREKEEERKYEKAKAVARPAQWGDLFYPSISALTPIQPSLGALRMALSFLLLFWLRTVRTDQERTLATFDTQSRRERPVVLALPF